jgi:hypothetical protein
MSDPYWKISSPLKMGVGLPPKVISTCAAVWGELLGPLVGPELGAWLGDELGATCGDAVG